MRFFAACCVSSAAPGSRCRRLAFKTCAISLLCPFLLVAFLLCTAGCGNDGGEGGSEAAADSSGAATEADAKSYKWKISQGIAEDHPAAARCKQFAKLVGEKSEGRIKLTYFPAGALGDWMEQIEGNRMGTLEIGLNAGSTSYDPRTNLMFMPYLFSTWDEARAVYWGSR